MTAVSIFPKGMNFTRVALALTRGENIMGARGYAEEQWGPASVPAMIIRSAVAAGSTTNSTWASALAEYRIAASEFIEALRPLTLLGRMSGFRRAPLRVKIPRATAGSSVGWVGESKPILVSRLALDTVTLDNYKIAGIVASTIELVKLSTPAADGLVRADLLAAVASLQDRALLDPDAAEVAEVSPASITYDATQIASTGSSVVQITADLQSLFEVLVLAGINMTSPYFITDPRVAFKLAMKRNTDGTLAFPGMGVRGGEVGGVPVLVTGNSPESADSPPTGGSIVLLDAAELIVCDTNEIMLDMSTQASIQLDTAPDSPPTASTNLVSLWQNNLAAWKVVRPINWKMRRDGAVAVLTGVAY
jgi:HK97 family phage major capsid protein